MVKYYYLTLSFCNPTHFIEQDHVDVIQEFLLAFLNYHMFYHTDSYIKFQMFKLVMATFLMALCCKASKGHVHRENLVRTIFMQTWHCNNLNLEQLPSHFLQIHCLNDGLVKSICVTLAHWQL